MPKLIGLNEVHATKAANEYLAIVDMDTWDNGAVETRNYRAVPGDTVGIAHHVYAAVQAWIAGGNPVVPYDPPTAEELREQMPPLTPRQLRLALASVGITEAAVDAKLVGDTEGQIEWKWASLYKRTHPLIETMGLAFALPPEQIDSLWEWAATQ